MSVFNVYFIQTEWRQVFISLLHPKKLHWTKIDFQYYVTQGGQGKARLSEEGDKKGFLSIWFITFLLADVRISSWQTLMNCITEEQVNGGSENKLYSMKRIPSVLKSTFCFVNRVSNSGKYFGSEYAWITFNYSFSSTAEIIPWHERRQCGTSLRSDLKMPLNCFIFIMWGWFFHRSD